MSIQMDITQNGTTTLATAGKYCDKNIDVHVEVDDTPAYEAGMQAEYDRFWDAYQENGTRTDYRYAFYGIGWTDETYIPKYPLQVTNAAGMYADTKITKRIDIDTSACTNFTNTFSSAKALTTIGTIDTRSAATLNQIFAYMDKLKTIEKLILKDDGSQTFSADCFGWDVVLADIVIEGTIGNSVSFRGCYNLTTASATSIINALSSTTSGFTLTLQSNVKTRFTNAEWSALVATKPNWTISLL